MSRPERPTTRRHVILYTDTYERLIEVYGEHPGFSCAIRQILDRFFANLDAKAAAKGQSVIKHHLPEFDLKDLT